MSNVQVLTAGSRFDQEKAREEGKPMRATVVTLLVTPEDAERISLAANEGQIMLTLRNPLDVAPTTTGRRADGEPARCAGAACRDQARRRTAGRARRQRRAAPAPAPAPKIYTVEAIRAAKRTEESVK